jgi:hypothetical protein
MCSKISLLAGAALAAISLSPASAQYYYPYQGQGYGPGCGPPGVYGCGGAPYQGRDRGPAGTYGWQGYRPYAGPGNGPPADAYGYRAPRQYYYPY